MLLSNRSNNRNYALKETLYDSLYTFYLNSPKTYSYPNELPNDWEKDYYSMFLQKNASDNSIFQIANDLKNLGAEKKLTDDQIVELTLAFVQSIPYDHVRAEAILSGTGQTIYPYETLYQNQGVCSDKSFLLANLLSEMGYSTALLAYDDEHHMAVGIGCPAEFSSYDSGYCYAETTSSGFRIGMIPNINSKEGSAVPMEKKSYSQNSEVSQFDAKKLGEPKIFPISSGKTYSGIADSLALAKKIDALNREITTLEKNLIAQKSDFSADEEKLSELEKKLKKLEKNGDYKEYNKLVEDYNDLLKKYKKKIKIYNEQIDIYNQKINLYNSLVKSF
ncbi:MAG: transglutaminase-like domain-containing protein [Candidatus Moraniibacteriota bacterium]